MRLSFILQDDSGGYITIENIKKEKEDVNDTLVKVLDPGQPLPPGEDL